MTITELTADIQTIQSPMFDCGDKRMSIKKSIERFLKDIFGNFDIDLADFKKGTKYILDDYVANYIKEKILSYSLPSKKEVDGAFEYAAPLSIELLKIAKHFIDKNFTDKTLDEIKEIIETEKENIQVRYEENIRIQQAAFAECRDFTFAFLLIGRELQFSDIDKFILEVQCCYKEDYDDGSILNGREITLINYMRLPKILKAERAKLSKQIVLSNISNISKLQI